MLHLTQIETKLTSISIKTTFVSYAPSHNTISFHMRIICVSTSICVNTFIREWRIAIVDLQFDRDLLATERSEITQTF